MAKKRVAPKRAAGDLFAPTVAPRTETRPAAEPEGHDTEPVGVRLKTGDIAALDHIAQGLHWKRAKLMQLILEGWLRRHPPDELPPGQIPDF